MKYNFARIALLFSKPKRCERVRGAEETGDCLTGRCVITALMATVTDVPVTSRHSEDTVFNCKLSSLGQSNTAPNDTRLTPITSDSNYRSTQLHIGFITDVFCTGLIVFYQSTCHLWKDVNMMNG